VAVRGNLPDGPAAGTTGASQQIEKGLLKSLDKVRADRAAKLAKSGTTSVTTVREK
jgi:hypothetical protein